MSDVVIVALITGTFALLSTLIPLISAKKSGVAEKVDKLATKIEKLEKTQDELGDIVYQMLDHMATSNNSGGMKRCLDQYNSFNRHN